VNRLEGCCAAITGGARGIGRGIAERFIAEGACVVLLDINADRATETAREIGCESIRCDVTSSESVHTAIESVVESLGGLDILVNSAGYSHIAPIEKTTEEIWDRTLSINLKGMFLTIQAVIPHMKAAGTGRVINLSSQSGKKGTSSYSAYCASKFGIIGLTQALAREFAQTGVTVNAICPGIVFTELWDDEHIAAYGAKRGLDPSEVKDYLVSGIPMKRAATVDDIASMAVFLASEESAYMTGQAINVTGGGVMH
jgi:NAD(P)-dependent dehydrogenase (short-subunit alcohol dehydrogenase family)